jgi:hypothetical protein
MLKAFTPVAILLISAAFKIQALNQRLVMIVVVRSAFISRTRIELTLQLISLGCALGKFRRAINARGLELTLSAAYGEINFEMFGFLCQTSAVAFESSRLVMIQILLQGLKVRYSSPGYVAGPLS